MLTDTDKAAAKVLGLTMDEARIAKATRISFERYAYHKAVIIGERAAVQVHEEQFNDQLVKRAGEWVKNAPGRGEPLPDREESD